MPTSYYRDKFACPFGCPMHICRNKWATHIIKCSNTNKPTIFVCKFSMYHIFTNPEMRDEHNKACSMNMKCMVPILDEEALKPVPKGTPLPKSNNKAMKAKAWFKRMENQRVMAMVKPGSTEKKKITKPEKDSNPFENFESKDAKPVKTTEEKPPTDIKPVVKKEEEDDDFGEDLFQTGSKEEKPKKDTQDKTL
uniref:Conjugation-specific protein n=1 Tax=Euplotes crassus TaxID=5936 RepID=P92159_EUPCR|nr:conjugation-specific protein [Moneuplotes crassus]